MTVSEHWPEFDSEPPKLESEATGESSANGAISDYAIGVAEPLGEEATATDGEVTEEATATDRELTEDAPTATEPTGDASVSDAADVAPAEAADDGSAFLAELVRTMQATAGLERIRIGEAIERRRQERVDQVQARKASEADRMRVLAAEDKAAIEAWVDGETARIKLERERRATAVHEDLDTSLAEHASKIDREIEGIESALATYRAEVEAYFEGLDRETDPILIAQKAASRPVFPALDVSGETVVATSADEVEAEPTSTDEPAVVGVMDPEAAPEPVESWAASPGVSPELVPAGAFDDIAQSGEVDEPIEPAAAAEPSRSSAGSLLHSVQILRPMSWLRRDANGGDRANGEG